MNTLLALALCALPGAPYSSLPPQDDAPETRPEVAPVEPLAIEGVQPLHRVGPVLLAGQPGIDAFQALVERGVNLVIDLRRPEEERGFEQDVLLEELGVHYEVFGFGGSTPLTDGIFDSVRELLARHRAAGEGEVLVHCASSNRVGAVWATFRVLDEGVPWDTAIAEAKRAGLRTPALEEMARHYVLGAGKQELGAMKLRLRAEHPNVARISAAELEARMAQEGPKPLLIDARQPAEFDVSHLRGAQRAATAAEARALLEGTPPESEIVVYCSVGKRSAMLAEDLTQAGYTSVKNLEGSIFEWANTGRPLYRGDERAQLVHPFDEYWGRLLNEELRADLSKTD